MFNGPKGGRNKVDKNVPSETTEKVSLAVIARSVAMRESSDSMAFRIDVTSFAMTKAGFSVVTYRPHLSPFVLLY